MNDLSKKELEEKLIEAQNEIERLKEQIKKYKIRNSRGAGRKGKMTDDDKQKILELRAFGVSFNKIAIQLSLPVGTVFNYSSQHSKIINNLKEITNADKLSDSSQHKDDMQNAVNKEPADSTVNELIEKMKNRSFMSLLKGKK